MNEPKQYIHCSKCGAFVQSSNMTVERLEKANKLYNKIKELKDHKERIHKTLGTNENEPVRTIFIAGYFKQGGSQNIRLKNDILNYDILTYSHNLDNEIEKLENQFKLI